MSVQTWTFIAVGITFGIYVGSAIWSRARSTGDFYVASGGVSPVANGMATAADWMSAASFISMAGLISFMGYDGSVYLMGWTGASSTTPVTPSRENRILPPTRPVSPNAVGGGSVY